MVLLVSRQYNEGASFMDKWPVRYRCPGWVRSALRLAHEITCFRALHACLPLLYAVCLTVDALMDLRDSARDSRSWGSSWEDLRFNMSMDEVDSLELKGVEIKVGGGVVSLFLGGLGPFERT